EHEETEAFPGLHSEYAKQLSTVERGMTGGLKTINRYLLAGAGVIGIFAAAPEAKAQQAQDLQQIQTQIQEMQATIQALQKQVADAKVQAAAANATAANAGGGDLDLKIKWKGAPELSSSDGKFSFKVRGRLQADYNAIDQDFNLTGRPDVSAAEIRRARLGVEGVVFYNVAYKFEVDFANDITAVKDAYFEYTCWGSEFKIRIGNFKTFNSLEHIMSANFIEFMERAAFIEGFQLDRQIGIGALFTRDHYTLAAGVFGPHPFDEERWFQDVKTGSARVTAAPINEDGHVLHFGASWRSRGGATDLRTNPVAANDQFFTYQARGADLHLASRFIVAPAIFDQDTFYGLEAAYVHGPWSIQGEYAQLKGDVNERFVGNDPTYWGWYVEASWFLTGETRPYKFGEFTRQKVLNPVYEGGHGAWQIVARYDVLSLTDNAETIVTCTTCGEQKTWQLGVNWWLNDHTRVMFNYGQSAIAGGFLDGNNLNDGADIKGAGTRLQIDW
ncbi:MAG TPA: porin, partial [Mesorhizobium sp.]|nr:porin [Mesorhizobium sp.]